MKDDVDMIIIIIVDVDGNGKDWFIYSLFCVCKYIMYIVWFVNMYD